MNRWSTAGSTVYALFMGLAAVGTGAMAIHDLATGGLPSRDVLLFSLAAFPAVGFARALRSRASVSLDLAFLLAASLLFPVTAGLLVALPAGLLVAALRFRGDGARRLPGEFAVAAGSLCLIAAAASAGLAMAGRSEAAPIFAASRTTVSPVELPRLLEGASLGWLLMIALSTCLAGIESLLTERHTRGGRSTLWLIVPDLAAIPAGVLLALGFLSAKWTAFPLMAALSLGAAVLAWILLAARRELGEANVSLARRMEEIRSLSAAAREAAACQSPDRMFERLAREIGRVFTLDRSILLLLGPESGEIEHALVTDASGRHRKIPQETARRLMGLMGWVRSTARPHLTRDVREEQLPPGLKRSLFSSGVRSLMAAPILIEGRPSGVVCLQSLRRGAYDAHALSVLSIFAGQAGIALESLRNYQRATRDELTGLYLRDTLYQKLQDEALRSERYGSPFAVMMLDLDAFKQMNDRHGHLAGDEYLRRVGETIRANLRAADVPCRFGGEEFCLLLPETDEAGAVAIAERIRRSVASLEVAFEGVALSTTISIGVAIRGEETPAGVPGIIRRADEALYSAKRSGRNRVVSEVA